MDKFGYGTRETILTKEDIKRMLTQVTSSTSIATIQLLASMVTPRIAQSLTGTYERTVILPPIHFTNP